MQLTECQQDLSDARSNKTNLKASIKKLEDELKENYNQNGNRNKDVFLCGIYSIPDEVIHLEAVNVTRIISKLQVNTKEHNE